MASSTLRNWSYKTSLIFFIVFFIGFCSVIPIDTIVQASKSSNYALNTFVVAGALVLFGVTAIILTISRIYIQKSSLQDIPKRYVPLDDGDLPKECDVMINENFAKCEKIRSMGLDTNEDVKHPGLSGPKSELLPPSLSFDDVVRAVGDKFKYDGFLMGTETKVPKNSSFREIISYLENQGVATDLKLNRDYAELYETLRYSGNLINEQDFIKFMQLCIDFVKLVRFNMGETEIEPIDTRRYSESEISRSTTGNGLNSTTIDFYSKLSLPKSSQQPRHGSTSVSYLDPFTTNNNYNNKRPSYSYDNNHASSSISDQRYQDQLKRVGTSQTVLSFRSNHD
ncbi:putative membrane protein [Wickerhamomyces ciferrii]|uniref:Defect at low temperature protein 1 n=1 Tax=Wickerhamomyces ciferrii (strain ATCC 14091 / BCRC 22168 / CBS 111 / JCM 3599 / NBRC 0793 / NRRL Y-1031 F-60-10) TaxID=1206466 RepID=K0KY84_WICCF|nr:uncharacterized protein BN7_5646 [Wickerhamomyces ciferrii]CCH46058.1 putative membrane protein [Wickerhamomyces ciferrii]